jgi:hypothetical protein
MKTNIANKLYIIFFGLLTIAYVMPLSIWIPAIGLDPSWLMALGWAVQHHIQFGKDFIWTYGPLGFLASPLFYQAHILWFLSFIFIWIISLLFILIILVLYSDSKIAIIIVSLLLMLFLAFISFTISPPTILILLSLIILVYNYKYENKINIVWLMIYGLLLSIASLIKVSHIFSATILLIFPLILEENQRRIKWLIPFTTYIVSFLFFWIITGQNLSNIANFIYYSFYLMEGYSSAMVLHGEHFQTIIAILILLIILAITLLAIIKKNKEFAKYLIISFPIVFEYFKEGFVRHDPVKFGHADYFFTFIGLYFIISYLNIKNEFKFKKTLIIILFILLPLIGMYYNTFKSLMPSYSRFDSFKQALYLLKSSENRNNFQKSIKQQMRNSLNIPKIFIKKIGNSSVNIIPWDLNIAYAYNLKLLPSPVIQAYSVYTPQLDEVNASQINRGKSAKFIIYKLETIDGRYPLYDEPSTLRSILFNYKLYKCINALCLLQKNNKNKSKMKIVKLKSINAKLGQPVNVPKFYNGYEFAKVTINYSLFGKFMNIIYKDSPIYIKFMTNSFISPKYRFIQNVGIDGIFISEYVQNINIFGDIFKKRIYLSNIIKHIIFTTSSKFEYNKNIKISFYGYTIKKNIIIKKLGIMTLKPPSLLAYKIKNNSLYKKAWIELSIIYFSRPDLQIAFPEHSKNFYVSLLHWVITAGVGTDPAKSVLAPFKKEYNVMYKNIKY